MMEPVIDEHVSQVYFNVGHYGGTWSGKMFLGGTLCQIFENPAE